MRVFLIRHAEVPGNKEKRYIGRTDELLTNDGILQAKSVRPPLVKRIYSSPYLRCLQTAKYMFPNQTPIVCHELRECDFGLYEGKTANELAEVKEYQIWVEGGCTGPIPGGESVFAFRERCCLAFEKIVRSEVGKSDSLAFLVHGGVIMSVLQRFDVRKLDFYAYHLDNCAYVSCDCIIDTHLLLTEIGDELC